MTYIIRTVKDPTYKRPKELSLPVARRFVPTFRATTKYDKPNNWWIIEGKNEGFNSEKHSEPGKIARL